MSQNHLLRAKEVAFGFSHSFLFTDVTFEVFPGEVVCLLGNNGAGKSTLLRICAGLLRPSCGHVSLIEKNIEDVGVEERASHLSYLPQNTVRAENFKAWQFVAMGDEWRRFVEGRSRLTAAESESLGQAFAGFDAVHLSERTLSSLSGGEWARVQLARVWHQHARVVLLDEPTAGVDLSHVALVAKRCRAYARKHNAALLLSTHDLGFAFAVADRFCVLDSGTLVLECRRKELEGTTLLERLFGVKLAWVDSEDGVDKLPVPLVSAR